MYWITQAEYILDTPGSGEYIQERKESSPWKKIQGKREKKGGKGRKNILKEEETL